MYRNIFHPQAYHGGRPPYFEGWYFKCVDAASANKLAIIPGVYLGRDKSQSHAFIQIIRSGQPQSPYLTYPLSDFRAEAHRFNIRIGQNSFAADHIGLNHHDDQIQIEGELHFSGTVNWPIRFLSPGIMGPYAWAPFMQTYHGIVSLDHGIQGQLRLNGETLDFNRGRGYTEKDWGRSFPSAWIWMQSNHFGTPGICLTASVAIIPWLWGTSFPGFIVGFLHGGRLYRFATYTGARIDRLELDGSTIVWHLSDRKFRLEIAANRPPGMSLQAPTPTAMDRRITEAMDAEIAVRLLTRANGKENLLFEGTGRHGGLEVMGDLEKLLKLWEKAGK
jgi:tocopherol cyclase